MARFSDVLAGPGDADGDAGARRVGTGGVWRRRDWPGTGVQHGLCGGAGQIAEAMQGLEPQRWQGLECRGHGASPLGETVSMAVLPMMLRRCRGDVGLDGCAGTHLDGAAIYRLAVLRPDLVRALGTVRPLAVIPGTRHQASFDAEVGMLLDLSPLNQGADVFSSRARRRGGWRKRRIINTLKGFFRQRPLAETAAADGDFCRRTGDCGCGFAGAAVPALVCGCAKGCHSPNGPCAGFGRSDPGGAAGGIACEGAG